MVPSWNVGEQSIRVWPEKVTVRSLLERSPEVGSEEAIAATTEGLRRLVAMWENAEEGCWLLSVPPLLRALGYTDFSPRYAELLEAMRLLGLSVRLHVYGWVGTEELRRQHMWDARTHEVMNRQRRATRLNQDKEFALQGIKIRLGSWGPARDPRPKFDRRSPRRNYRWATVEEWSQFPASRGLSPAEADRLAVYLGVLHRELEDARLARRSSFHNSDTRIWERGGPEEAEFAKQLRLERQIEGVIGKLATGSREDLLDYERTSGQASGQED